MCAIRLTLNAIAITLAVNMAVISCAAGKLNTEAKSIYAHEAMCDDPSIGIKIPATQTRLLKCEYFDNHRDPYLLIGPFKTELIHVEPTILLYHDILYDSEIRTLKELAPPKFYDREETGERIRVSSITWLRTHKHPLLTRLDRRIELATGLDLETAEPLQVINYSLGGHFETHVDSHAQNQDSENGLRIATFMFYMSDVENGGATIFPGLNNLVLWPVKGSAALWYNLQEDGTHDERTRHSGCPVRRGSKWVALKWARERGQDFRCPCGQSSIPIHTDQ